MRAIAPRFVLALALASVGLGCPMDPDAEISTVVRDATEAIIEGDEQRFVRAHVQPNDMTPDGNSWITTAAGGRRPDAAWNDELRAAFRQARADLQRIAGASSDLEFIEIRDLQTGTHGMRDSEWFGKVTGVAAGGGATYTFRYDTGMLSKRGWVLTGDPKVTISKT